MDIHKRTIAKDIGRLIKQKKITQKQIDSLDRDLRVQAIAYASTMEDVAEEPISIRSHSLRNYDDPNVSGRQTIRPTPAKIAATPIPHNEAKYVPPPQPIKPITPPSPPPPPPKPKPIPPPPPPPKPTSPPTPPPPKPIQQPPKVNAIEDSHVKKEEELQSEREKLLLQKTDIEKDIQGFMSERNGITHTLSSLRDQEREVEQEEMRIRRELREVTPIIEKKVLEEKRWSLEDKRQGLEKSRWETRKKEEIISERIQEKRKELDGISSMLQKMETEINNLNLKKEADKAKAEMQGYEDDHAKIVEKKKNYESEWSALGLTIAGLERKIIEKQKSLKESNREFEQIENKELHTDDEIERHKLEEKRWQADKVLRENEKELWNAQDELNKRLDDKKDLENTFASIQIQEEDIQSKIQQARAVIQKAERGFDK